MEAFLVTASRKWQPRAGLGESGVSETTGLG